MPRFEDTPGLFGAGVGGSTECNMHCDWCRTTYRNREDAEGEALPDSRTIGYVQFGGMTICDCCFEKVEVAVLRQLPLILPWFARMLAKERVQLEDKEGFLEQIRKGLEKPSTEVTIESDPANRH